MRKLIEVTLVAAGAWVLGYLSARRGPSRAQPVAWPRAAGLPAEPFAAPKTDTAAPSSGVSVADVERPAALVVRAAADDVETQPHPADGAPADTERGPATTARHVTEPLGLAATANLDPDSAARIASRLAALGPPDGGTSVPLEQARHSVSAAAAPRSDPTLPAAGLLTLETAGVTTEGHVPASAGQSPRRRLWLDASAIVAGVSLAVLIWAGIISVWPQSAPRQASLGGAVAGATRGPAPMATDTLAPTPSAAPTPTVVSNPTPSASHRPAPSPSPRPAVAPSLPTPSSQSLALLEPCPRKPGCYIYVVRRGDTLGRIARRFGLTIQAILRLNPQIYDPSIVVYRSRLFLPTPTR